jgi:hypothetical protein
MRIQTTKPYKHRTRWFESILPHSAGE